MKRVYLAGPINGCDDFEAKMWRFIARDELGRRGIGVLDPMSRDYRGVEDLSVAEIVEGDKADIEACDAVLAHCPRPSVGTSMEVLLAWQGGKPVVAVSPDPSPWLTYHADVQVGLLEAIDSLLERL